MGGELENLEMNLFDSDLELNLDYIPEEEIVDHTKSKSEEKDTSKEEKDTIKEEDGESSEKNNNLSENDTSEIDDKNSESVAKDDTSNEGENDNTSPNFYSSVATVLHEQGLLPSLDVNSDKKIESVDDFIEVFNKELDSQKFNNLNDLQKEALIAFENGINPDDFVTYKQTESQLDKITEDNIKEDSELAKNIIYQDFINQGLNDKRALKQLERIVELGEEVLLSDAITSLDSVKEFQRKSFKKEQEKNNREKIENIKKQDILNKKIKENIYNKEYLIKGQNFNKSIQDKVFKTMTTIVGRDSNNKPENRLMKERRDNPIEFDTTLYYIFELTNGFKDFSKLSISGESKAAKNLQEIMNVNPFINKGNQPDFIQDPDSYDGIGDELNI